MKNACLRGLLLLGAFLAFTSSASAAAPRVLAIHFDADVNPVTQNYVCHNLSRAAKDGYAAALLPFRLQTFFATPAFARRAAAEARPDHQRLVAEVLTRRLPQRLCQLRHA